MTPFESHRDVIATASADIPGLTEDGPLFQAPWQTRIFALIVATVRANHIPWTAFQERLAAAITRAEAGGITSDTEARYFDCWLEAAEDTLHAEGFVAQDDIARQIDAIRHSVDAIRAAQTHSAHDHTPDPASG
ncbi:nitrile hydratase accessory protein [Rhodobacteraceae bacterium KMM 6894]|nr:nitrile hydratase accessory protein [Rhodobacteraceae bacterium KMM 6894]